MPDTDDYGGFMLMTNVTRSHRGLLGSHILFSASAQVAEEGNTLGIFAGGRRWVGGEFGSNASPLLYRRRIQLRSGRTRTEPEEERTLAEETATSHAKP